MAGGCAVAYAQEAFVSGVLHYVDCQAQSLGSSGYQALAGAQSGFMLVIAGLLIVAVALFGYRMLAGRLTGPMDAVGLMLKLAVALTLATNWTAYQTVIYDVTMRGPTELISVIGSRVDIAARPDMQVEMLQQTDLALIDLGKLGVGRKELLVGNAAPSDPQSLAQGAQNGPSQAPFNAALAIDRSLDFAADANALRFARTIFLVGTVGLVAAMRLIAGLLLALGPVFAPLILFHATRSSFAAWFGALAWTMIASIGIAISIGLELAFLDPWLAGIVALRRADLPSGASPTEIMAFSLVFALISLGTVVTAAMVTRMGSTIVRDTSNVIVASAFPTDVLPSPALAEGTYSAAANRSRALAVSDAAVALQRREVAHFSTETQSSIRQTQQRSETLKTMEAELSVAARPFSNRLHNRVSAGAQRRDRIS